MKGALLAKTDRPLHQEPEKYGVWNTSGWAVLQGHIPCLVTSLGLVHWKRASSPLEAGTAGYL